MITPNSSKEGVQWATAVPLGDINGDGYTDVGVRQVRYDAVRTSIYAYYEESDLIIFYGSSNGIISSPQPVFTPLHPTDPLLVPPAVGANPSFPFAAGAGDVNGDGFADVVASDGATLYLYYGSTTGLQTSVAPTVPPTSGLNAVIVGQSDGTSYDIAASDYYGWGGAGTAIGAGDFNGDGYSDIVLGASSSFINITPPRLPAGALVIYGGAQGASKPMACCNAHSDRWLRRRAHQSLHGHRAQPDLQSPAPARRERRLLRQLGRGGGRCQQRRVWRRRRRKPSPENNYCGRHQRRRLSLYGLAFGPSHVGFGEQPRLRQRCMALPPA